MKILESLRKMTAEVIEDVKWPLRARTLDRAMQSVGDAAEATRLDTQQALIDRRKAFTQAKTEEEAREIFKEILRLNATLEDCDHTVKLFEAEYEYLNSEVKGDLAP